ncbi:MAG TPA: ABC transporter substrate-binding protein [Burkholderiales bacterium]|nr:ABC transporter substrate-binding protein [Burkholderiales bacterium]
MKRREAIVLGAAVLAAPFTVRAQRTTAVIGFLVPTTREAFASRIDGVKAGLRELGYAEGRDVAFAYRAADDRYERLDALAAELVALKADVLVTAGTPGALALKRATTTVPIVLSAISDPVATGVVTSLARPTGNITGMMFFVQELGVKRLEMLRQAAPQLKRVAVLMNADNASMVPVEREMRPAAKQLGLEMQRHDVRTPQDFDAAFAAMAVARAEALVIVEDAMLNVNAARLGAAATAKRLVSIGAPEVALGGGTFAYGVDQVAMFRRSAYFIDKILKGAKPADLPIERTSKFDLTVNLKSATALGLKLPQTVLLRADRVIE